MKLSVALHNAQQGHKALADLWQQVKPWLIAGHRLVVSVGEENRSIEQNRLLWKWLSAFSEQLQWPVNGVPVAMSDEDWKDVLTAAFQRETRVAQGLDGGIVILGARTSKMGKQRFGEFLDFIAATGAQRGVTIGDEP